MINETVIVMKEPDDHGFNRTNKTINSTSIQTVPISVQTTDISGSNQESDNQKSENQYEKLLSEYSKSRDELKKMLKDIEDCKNTVLKSVSDSSDYRNKYAREERLKTLSTFFSNMLQVRQEYNKTIQTEIEIRRKLDMKDDGEFELDIRSIAKQLREASKNQEGL